MAQMKNLAYVILFKDQDDGRHSLALVAQVINIKNVAKVKVYTDHTVTKVRFSHFGNIDKEVINFQVLSRLRREKLSPVWRIFQC